MTNVDSAVAFTQALTSQDLQLFVVFNAAEILQIYIINVIASLRD